jgi:hypothetical protein
MKWKTRAAVLGATLMGGLVVGGVGWAAAPLPTASAGSDHSTASALGVPGVLTLSETDANTNGENANSASWSAASVAGQSVLGKGNTNEWTGLLAALGPTIDMLNQQNCSSAPIALPTGGEAFLCVVVLPGQANHLSPNSVGNLVSGALILDEANETPLNGYYQFEVLGSFSQSGGCFNAAYANIARLRMLNGLGDQTIPVAHSEDIQECD